MGTIPWQASLGVAGTAVTALVLTLAWLIRNFVRGKFLTAEQSKSTEDALTKGHELVITALNLSHANEIANLTRYGNEWRETAMKEREGRELAGNVAYAAVKTSQALDHFFTEVTPKRGEVEDTSGQGGDHA
jgi:hypothetical protein